ncbi:spermidine synthase isoform X1 [Trichogramma pretiosum]|uniref:spermidine synthase isoform X1 n=2 Tax=Trichogramma pretiosum TaxID=7493 RepID=UPI0006C9DACF|nr:spermidine synthase isoform X1 [Trichogramma pretiosum]XP_014227192.1 spermidine synthase isoform X1 [Trichogramma pretiosum]XP_014227193.1 spermidine synthase isoform X1 [Trichogramma pretiosum]
MNSFRNGWFSEINDLWPGIVQSLEVDSILYNEHSTFQHIMVLQTKSHGRVLILDGIIQCTEKDEFSYQEMISFLPLCSHGSPKRVLIIGGGDGGVAREVAKYPTVEKIVQVEIDAKVVEVSKKFLPHMAKGYESNRHELIIEDGFKYLKNQNDKFDVIITDSSDPVGPAKLLFEKEYFELLKCSLRTNGVICCQAGTIWTNMEQVEKHFTACQSVFPKVNYGISSVPTYPTGQIGFLLGSIDDCIDFKQPRKIFSENELDNLNLSYYSSKIHESCFILPRFAEKNLKRNVQKHF